MLPLGRNKVLGRIKQGEGPDLAWGLEFVTCGNLREASACSGKSYRGQWVKEPSRTPKINVMGER